MPDTSAPQVPGYQVLARKYRPATFADLIGQDTMVRTLRNAFAADRIAHAFMLTGVRGVGKTTTARIIAKGLNCIGPDGTGAPTTEPCGVCDPCRAITEGRHVDVLEMDAASRTGVGDIREIIDSVHYRAASARYKIYIIDEVHMLSTNAFNALLKTLEEPPPHVKFIFATTEIRKVPVTVLSRCQRFDLRRIEPEAMMAHLARIAELEGAAIGGDALALLARAAEGSVRDAMSLMDQAIATGGEGTAPVAAADIRAMLGLADRGRVLDLFDLILRGEASAALTELSAQHAAGADPLAVLRDLAEVTHWVSVVKITPEAATDPTIPPDECRRGLEMAARLPMRALTRLWQMLLKALEELPLAPSALMASEMAVIRLTHAADLPDPEQLIRRLQSQVSPAQAAPLTPPPPQPARPAPVDGGAGPAPLQALPAGPIQALPAPPMVSASLPAARAVISGGSAPAPAMAPEPGALSAYADFPAVIDLIRAHRDMRLLVEVETTLRLARYSPGRIEFQPTDRAAPDLAARLGQRLQGWTGARWAVSVVGTGGGPTLAEAALDAEGRACAKAALDPLVQAVLAAFPGARIKAVRPVQAAPAPEAHPIPEADDAWDPFDDT